MKKSFLALVVGFSIATHVQADDLYQIYQLAQQNDPTVNRAKASKEEAYANISASRASLLPQISGRVSYDISSRDSVRENGTILTRDTDTLSLGLQLDQSIYDHSIWKSLSRSEKLAQQSDASYAAAKQTLIVRTINAYLAVLTAQDNLEFVRAEKRAIERQLEQTKQRFEVGLTAITDVHEAQANFDNTLAQEIRAENTVELRLEEIREITGLYHKDINPLNTDNFDTPAPSPAKVSDWLSLAEAKNLDILAQRIGKDIAKKDMQIATAGHLPTVDLRASLGRNDTEITQEGFTLDLPKTDSSSITLNLNIPIYSGGRTNAQSKAARFRYVAASENLELSHRSTVRSVRSSFNDVRATISTIKALEQAVVSAESALKATDAGFDVGTRTIVDVLDSTRNLYNAKRNLSSARYDYIRAILSLKQAAGTLSEQDLVAINDGLKKANS